MIKQIKIGYKTYKVIEDARMADAEGNIGSINYHDCEINVCPRLGKEMRCDTLVHEAVHGMLMFMGENDKNNDDNAVERIAQGVLMLIRDNPKLFMEFTKG